MAMPNKRQQDRSKVFMALFFSILQVFMPSPSRLTTFLFCGYQVFVIWGLLQVLCDWCFVFWVLRLNVKELWLVYCGRCICYIVTCPFIAHQRDTLFLCIMEALFCPMSNKCCCEPLNFCVGFVIWPIFIIVIYGKFWLNFFCITVKGEKCEYIVL